MAIFGLSRMGKTSLLRQLHHRLGGDYSVVHANLQGIFTPRALFEDMLASLMTKLKKTRTVPSMLIADPGRGTDEPATWFTQSLIDICRAGAAPALLVFDEIEMAFSSV